MWQCTVAISWIKEESIWWLPSHVCNSQAHTGVQNVAVQGQVSGYYDNIF
jgi:hypothetical protein